MFNYLYFIDNPDQPAGAVGKPISNESSIPLEERNHHKSSTIVSTKSKSDFSPIQQRDGSQIQRQRKNTDNSDLINKDANAIGSYQVSILLYAKY